MNMSGDTLYKVIDEDGNECYNKHDREKLDKVLNVNESNFGVLQSQAVRIDYIRSELGLPPKPNAGSFLPSGYAQPTTTPTETIPEDEEKAKEKPEKKCAGSFEELPTIPNAIRKQIVQKAANSLEIAVPHSLNIQQKQYTSMRRGTINGLMIGSADRCFSSYRSFREFLVNQKAPKSLINPFRPEEFAVQVTANRRRWIHVFPVDGEGRSKLAHHYVAGQSIVHIVGGNDVLSYKSNISLDSPTQSVRPDSPLSKCLSPEERSAGSSNQLSSLSLDELNKKYVWAWGSTGEEKWNMDLEVNTDWKSLVRSALLPITTDFFPDCQSLEKEYLVQQHQVYLGHLDFATIRNIYDQLICQRLQRGYQIVLLAKKLIDDAIKATASLSKGAQDECVLSFNKYYHKLSLIGDSIHITIFRPKSEPLEEVPGHPGWYPRPSQKDNPSLFDKFGSDALDDVLNSKYFNTVYTYFFQVPDALSYEKSTTKLRHHDLDKLNWSLFDCLFKDKFDAQLFEDEMKCFSASYIIVLYPRDIDKTPKMARDKVRGAEFRESCEFQQHDENSYAKFTQVLLCMNRLTYTAYRSFQTPKSPRSSAKAAEKEEATIIKIPKDDANFVLEEFKKTNPYVKASSTGFGDRKVAIHHPDNMFLTYDFAIYLKKHVEGIQTVAEAMDYIKEYETREIIRIVRAYDPDQPVTPPPPPTIPNQEQQPVLQQQMPTFEELHLIYGFQLCYIVGDQSPNLKTSHFLTVEYAIRRCVQPDEECGHQARRFMDIELAVPTNESIGEWSRIYYNTGFYPDNAFSFTMKWFLAMGQTVSDLLALWGNRAGRFGYSLYPVPDDPFALAQDTHSNPLRCPIRIDVKDIMEKDEERDFMIHFIFRFGFVDMKCNTKHDFAATKQSSVSDRRSYAAHSPSPSGERQYPVKSLDYVHQAGGMFLSLVLSDIQPPFFYWAWNHMLSNRYRGKCTETFQDYMLSEFRRYCANENNLLTNLLAEFREKRKNFKSPFSPDEELVTDV
ncbi:unnamed protein product [Caenorhabditis bovis]|uniref:DEPDC5 C-terminal domain-containing protein n=1 Tax=Caenorhabditis bovis TaxID=2654633 RepID=A0A8S1EM51_9PELO|nr:unnamed protein product [Caenorhabditis bovis]